MKSFLDCWTSKAKALFPQALSGGPELVDSDEEEPELTGVAWMAEVSGDVAGRFTITLDPRILDAPLLGKAADQTSAWTEFLRKVAEGAGELMAGDGQNCRIDTFGPGPLTGEVSCAFRLNSAGNSWRILVHDEVQSLGRESEASSSAGNTAGSGALGLSPGVELLMDVELEASLRFGCREMPLGEILELGPGDVVELDRHVFDPVDLVVGDKIVARGEVVLVNGNFGLRVTEVAAPQKRLESIRCLF